MSPEWERLGLRRGRWTFLPVAPRRLEFAAVVRKALLGMRPARVAVELPPACGAAMCEAVARLPAVMAVLSVPEEEDLSAPVAFCEPGDAITEACRTAMETGAELVFIGADETPLGARREYYPDPAVLARIPYERYVEQYLRAPPPPNDTSGWEAAGLLCRLDPHVETVVVARLPSFVQMLPRLDLAAPDEPRPSQFEYRADLVAPASLGEVLEDCPYLQERYEQWRGSSSRECVPDRRRWLADLWEEAAENYRAIYDGEILPWQRKQAQRFLERLVVSDFALVPSLFDLVAAARGVIDENLAYEVWRRGSSYGPQQVRDGETPVELESWQVFPETRRLRLRHRYELEKRRRAPRAWKRRPGRTPEAWAAQLDGDAICSYPPEDIVIEDFGRFLRQRAVTMLGEERSRVEPFTCSLLDGVDVRETIRRWHEGRIYVRETEKVTGEAGAVVVIFDEDRGNRYPWLTTWLGEHSNESDMAFYSTPPFENLVGPGIGRAEYGGFLMTMPPGRMTEVWTDPDYDFAETKPERLLLAAIDYSLERRIVYVAARPPRSILRQAAARLGRQILYIPLGALSPEKLRRIRMLHVLDSHARRRIASRYIW